MSSLPATRRAGATAVARLWRESAWILPSMFTVSAFSVLVGLTLVGATLHPAIAKFVQGAGRDESAGGTGPLELRSPERAVSETARGLLRRVDY